MKITSNMTLEEISEVINSRRKLTPEGETFEPMFNDEEMNNMEASLHHNRARMIANLVKKYNVPEQLADASLPKIPTKAELLRMYEERLKKQAATGYQKWISEH